MSSLTTILLQRLVGENVLPKDLRWPSFKENSISLAIVPAQLTEGKALDPILANEVQEIHA